MILYLVLEFSGVPGGHWHNTAVHVELPHNGDPGLSLQLGSEHIRREFSQPQQPHQDILHQQLDLA